MYSDVWAVWTELTINILVTLLLAPTYGIIGILIGKIVSFFFISFFWKPYYLFSQGFHKSVWEYWRGMAIYYVLFFIFAIIAIIIKQAFIDQHSESIISLLVYGFMVLFPLLLVYFIVLFQFSNGMKHFVARNTRIYKIMTRITF